MTKAHHHDGPSQTHVEDHYILEADFPAGAGPHSFSCDPPGGGSYNDISGYAVQLTGAAQQAPISNTGEASTVAAVSVTLTSVPVGAWVAHNVRLAVNRLSTIAATSPFTLIATAQNSATSNETQAVSSWINDTAGNVTPEMTWTSNSNASTSAVAFEEAATSAPVIRSDAGVFFGHGIKGRYRIQPVNYPDAEEEAAYTLSPTPTAINGQTPVTWSAVASLPSGLSISSSTGVITGTPAAASAGTYPFTLKTVDAGGGIATRNTSITVQDAGSGSLTWVTETAEDGNLTADPAWTTPGGCSVTSLGVLEGSNEVSKTTSTDCVLVDNIDAPEVYVGWDEWRDLCPATDRPKAVVVLGSADEELATVLIETDCDMFVKTPGIPDNAGRGHKIAGGFSSDPDRDRRVDFHYAKGAGSNAVLRARTDNGTILEFSAGTATANVDRIIFRQENDAAANFVRDRITIDDAGWANLDPIGGDPPPESQPWIYSFAPVRTHYVDDIACGGTGTIGNPECWQDAFDTTHYQCGDLHNFREGDYRVGDATVKTLDKNCTQENPAVFKGYVNPATGQPERAKTVSHFALKGAWTWFVGLEMTDEVSTSIRNMLDVRCDGCMVINTILYENRYSDNLNVWEAAQNVIYGNVLYRPGPLDVGTPNGHNIYTHNDFDSDGWKYYIQNINMEIDPCCTQGRLVNMRTSTGFLNGFHWEKNLFAEAVNQVNVRHQGGGTTKRMKFVDNYHFNYGSPSSHRGLYLQPQPNQFEVTNNYFAKSNFAPAGYWGTARPSPGNIFTGNEIYDPLGGDHIQMLRCGNADPTDGASKIHNSDVWDNNTYGGTFRAGTLFCNGSSANNRTLAQWRTETNAARVTPGSAGFDLNSTEVSNPTTNKIVVLKNEWQCPSCTFNDMARGNIYIANWANSTTQTVDISSVVGPSKQYTVRYARDFFGTPAASGTCPGSGACNVELSIRRSHGEGATLFTGAYIVTGQP